jgi:hypothetical protein
VPSGPGALEAAAEGSYGKGSLPHLQRYEAASGVSFYQHRGKVYRSGLTDLKHLAEGYGRYSIAGSAEYALDQAAKAREALRQGDAKSLRKYLQRLEQGLAKSKSLARVSAGARGAPAVAAEVEGLRRALEGFQNDPAGLRKWLATEKVQSRLMNTLVQANSEAVCLSQLARTSHPAQIGVLHQMLEESAKPAGRWHRTRHALNSVYRRVPWGQASRLAGRGLGVLLRALTAAAAGGDAWQVGRALSQEGLNKALLRAGYHYAGWANLPAMLSRAYLDDARETLVGWAAGLQGCEDLLAGIYSVPGRQKVTEPGQGPASVEELAKVYMAPEPLLRRLEAVIHDRARRAAAREAGGRLVGDTLDLELYQRLTGRCIPALAAAWQGMRQAMAAACLEERLAVDRELSSRPLRLAVRSRAEPGRYLVRVAPLPGPAAAWTRRVQALRRRVQDLGGLERQGGLAVRESYTWLVDGRIAGEEAHHLTWEEGARGVLRGAWQGGFTRRGARTVGLRYRLSVEPFSPAQEAEFLEQTVAAVYELEASVEVEPAWPALAIAGPGRGKVGQTLRFAARVTEQDAFAGMRVVWSAGGRRGEGPELALAPAEAGRLVVSAALVDPDPLGGGGPAEVARASHTVEVAAVAEVSFRLVDAESRRPLAGATVRLGHAGRAQAKTDAAGRAHFPELATGLYEATYSAPGYQSAREMLPLGPKHPASYLVALSPEAEADTAPPARKPAPAPARPAPPAQGKCEYRAVGAWEGATAQATHPGKEEDGPAAATYSISLPGPGTLRLTLGTTGGHQMSNHEYGACRGAAKARLASQPSVMGNGWVRGGLYFPGVRDYDEGSYSWKVKGAGPVTIRVFGENCYARKAKPDKCWCHTGGRQGTLWLPTRYKLKAEFKPCR